jgi:hypothetical protein
VLSPARVSVGVNQPYGTEAEGLKHIQGRLWRTGTGNAFGCGAA